MAKSFVNRMAKDKINSMRKHYAQELQIIRASEFIALVHRVILTGSPAKQLSQNWPPPAGNGASPTRW